MNPQDFSWTEDQQVTVINPTSESYKFKVHSKEYELGAGKTAKMPGYIAWVYVYGLASQLAQAAGEFNRWNEEGFRQTYYEKVTSGVEPVVQPVDVEEQPLVETLDDDELPAVETEPAEEPEEPSQPSEEEVAASEQKEPKPGIVPMKPKAKSHDRSASRA